MTLEQYAYLAEILGVIVVIVTLIYLSMQVRQGSNLLRSEARQAQVNNDQNNIYKFIEHPELGSLYCTKERPSFEEKVRLHFWIIASMRAREHEWLQYNAGNLDEATWLSDRGVIFFTLGTERARALWNSSSAYFNQEFADMVKGMIEQAPLIDVWDQIDAVA